MYHYFFSLVCLYSGFFELQDESGRNVCSEDGDLLIHTDGTGFISEDLAMKYPRGCYNAKYLKVGNLEVRILIHYYF